MCGLMAYAAGANPIYTNLRDEVLYVKEGMPVDSGAAELPEAVRRRTAEEADVDSEND